MTKTRTHTRASTQVPTMAAILSVLALALALALAGCGGAKPYQYTEVDEIPPGPGLFTGEKGEFTVYRK